MVLTYALGWPILGELGQNESEFINVNSEIN